MSRQIYRLAAVILLLSLAAGQVNAQSTIPIVTWQKLLDGNVSGVSISPDGKYISYGSSDTEKFTVFDWQANTIEWQIADGGYYGVQSRWSPNGRYIATWLSPNYMGGKARSIQIYDATNGKHLTQVENALSVTENILRHISCCGELTRDAGYTDSKWSDDSNKLAVLAYGYIIVYDLSTNTIPTIIHLFVDNTVISSFDWSPDSSTFAAVQFKRDKTNNRMSLPQEVVIGFWNQEGAWQSQYEQTGAPVSGEECIPDGENVFLSSSLQIGGDVEWAPDKQTVAVSIGHVDQITVCSLQSNGKLLVHQVFPAYSNHIHWSPDQKWLFAILSDCTMLTADVTNDYANHLQPFDAENCDVNSAGWNSDSRYLAVGTSSGLWLGKVELPT